MFWIRVSRFIQLSQFLLNNFQVCATYQQMLDDNNPPHLVLDATRAGLASETVKSFTAALGIPTGLVFYLFEE